jgi:hypothetical protein
LVHRGTGELSIGGNPVWEDCTKFRVRQATAREATELEVAFSTERARAEYEGYVFAFMVSLDAAPQ